jgi:hypothetical protein
MPALTARKGTISRGRNSAAPSTALVSAPCIAIASFTPSWITSVGAGSSSWACGVTLCTIVCGHDVQYVALPPCSHRRLALP